MAKLSALRPTCATPPVHDPYGRDFLAQLWQTPAKTRDGRLQRIAAALHFLTPQLGHLKVAMGAGGAPHLYASPLQEPARTTRLDERQLSDGTLRLIGLLWTLLDGEGPLLLEEPEISLHPEIVRRLPAVFHLLGTTHKPGRQIIIATHTLELLRDPGIGTEEVLLLAPQAQGTILSHGNEADRQALMAGLTAADVLMPQTAPAHAEQFAREFVRYRWSPDTCAHQLYRKPLVSITRYLLFYLTFMPKYATVKSK